MIRLLFYIMVGITTSLYFFSFGFTFLPTAINTKLILAVIGGPIVVYHLLRSDQIKMNRYFLYSIVIAVLFSLSCLISVDLSNTFDYSYVTYIVSFSVWIFSAYSVCTLIRLVHKDISIKILTNYLAGVCVAQCLLALVIDNNVEFRTLVNTYIEQDQLFLIEVQRLYGIGASLDNAGVRFSIVLILIASVLSIEPSVKSSSKDIWYLVSCFFIIIVIGNIISRTTILGAGIGLLILVWKTNFLNFILKYELFKFYKIFIFLAILGLGLTIYFYNTNQEFYFNIRFAFEGFFNWVEKGVWRTDSTDKLTSTMWVWPTDTKTWIVGTGLFDNWVFGTDIGYCRFILYCGLCGFSIFSFFFLYNAYASYMVFPRYLILFIAFTLLTFLVWLKVSTDIFLIYALIYCVYMLGAKETKIAYK